MLTDKIRSFSVGTGATAFIASLPNPALIYESLSIQMPQEIHPALLVCLNLLLISIVAVLIYFIIVYVLLRIHLFRSIFFPQHARFEGAWASDLVSSHPHPAYPCSYASIEYSRTKHEYKYSGIAFTQAGAPDGNWSSISFLFDKSLNDAGFTFRATGQGQMPARDKVLPLDVQSLGTIERCGKGESKGSCVDLSPVGYGRGSPVQFDIHLYRITGNDRKSVFGKKRDPISSEEKYKLTIEALKRNGVRVNHDNRDGGD